MRFAVLMVALIALPSYGADLAPGIPNFHRVNEHLYRGGQPSEEGWKSLSKLGVKTVIDLRRERENNEHSLPGEAQAVERAGMRYVSEPMNGIVAPSDEQIARILAILESGEPVFVHCREGKDRTGTVIACYRISHDRWKQQQAMKEAKAHGFHWFEAGMKRYIASFKGVPATMQSQAGRP